MFGLAVEIFFFSPVAHADKLMLVKATDMYQIQAFSG